MSIGLVRLLDPYGGTEHSAAPDQIGLPDGARDAVLLSPPLVDLVAWPSEPGYEHRETMAALARAARLGGVATVGLMPDTEPTADHDGVIRTLLHGARTKETGVRFLPHGALSVGLEHSDIAPMGELKAAGVHMVADGGRPVRDTRFLRRALEYARNFELPVFLRPTDPWLSDGALAPEGPEATRFGLPAVPDAAERLAVLRAGELARLTDAEVVVFPLVTAAGVEALADARRRGASLHGGTALPYLIWTVDELGRFDGHYRLDPPLPRADDAKALADAVRSGDISFLATGHRAVNLSEKRAELPMAVPGMAVLADTWSLLLAIESKWGVPLVDLVRAMTVGPSQIAGLEKPAGSVAICPRDPDAPVDRALATNLPFDGKRYTTVWMGSR